MTDRTVIIAALIVGGAIVAASIQTRPRYALSAASNNVVWRMDTWSGQIDLCAAAHSPAGPLVRCGATVVVPVPQQEQTAPPPTSIPPGQPL
jgi:hypothetical protein